MQRNGENDSFPDWFFAAQAAVAPTSLPPYSLLAEKALLDLRVADISCGSGHILLAAARRIATELAIVRTGEEQPSPSAFRSAIRDVIRNCIYGVDLNPLAVELCKVALWLEAHSPGEPLNFLDHHIKCGNAIVGFTTREEAERGVPDEAFAMMPGDDKEIAALLRKRNKQERKDHETGQLPLSPSLQKQLDDILRGWRDLATLPEHTRDLTPAQVAKVSKKSVEEAEAGYQGILELRRLHRELDLAIRDAYGWNDPSTGSGGTLDLDHDFVEVETLPENDRVRYTISPAARKEVLKRLLAENHRRATIEAATAPAKPKARRGSKAKGDDIHGDLFA